MTAKTLPRVSDYKPGPGDTSPPDGLEDFADWGIVSIQSRDNDETDRWDTCFRLMPETDNVQVVDCCHWAFGWLKLLLVRPNTEEYRMGLSLHNQCYAGVGA